MAADWVANIIETPYLILPIVAYLWMKANFPNFKWNKVAAGALLSFAGNTLQTLVLALSPYLSNPFMIWPASIVSVIGTVCIVVGLFIMGIFLLTGAISTWRSTA